ncbi:MAG: hypothetical protein IJ575_10920 [Selenomonadaceae bacterium]|nr:hypothetical protein [Selenomonadaceae bacterium]
MKDFDLQLFAGVAWTDGDDNPDAITGETVQDQTINALGGNDSIRINLSSSDSSTHIQNSSIEGGDDDDLININLNSSTRNAYISSSSIYGGSGNDSIIINANASYGTDITDS